MVQARKCESRTEAQMLLQRMLSLEETWGQREGKLTPSVAPGTLLGRRKVVEEAGHGDRGGYFACVVA